MLIWFVVCVLVCGRFGLYCLWGCGGSSGYGWCSWCCSGCVWGDLLDCVGQVIGYDQCVVWVQCDVDGMFVSQFIVVVEVGCNVDWIVCWMIFVEWYEYYFVVDWWVVVLVVVFVYEYVVGEVCVYCW